MSPEKTEFDLILPPAGGKTLPKAFDFCKENQHSCMGIYFFDSLRAGTANVPVLFYGDFFQRNPVHFCSRFLSKAFVHQGWTSPRAFGRQRPRQRAPAFIFFHIYLNFATIVITLSLFCLLFFPFAKRKLKLFLGGFYLHSHMGKAIIKSTNSRHKKLCNSGYFRRMVV